MNLTETIAPKSDQLNADDLLAGPQNVTVAEVRKGASAEQPVDIVLAEFGPGRPFKPSKTVRRILVAAWGAEAEEYVGRRMTLYCDPDVKFGGATVGGIRVSHMSDIGKPLNLKLTTTRGKRTPFTVQTLPEAAPTTPQISDKVRADTAKAVAEGNIADYLAYLAANGAPEHITGWVKEQTA